MVSMVSILKASLFVVSLSLLVSPSYGIACTAQYQCVYTQDYNYVNCTNGQCVCLTAQGFVGNATAQANCSCLSPNTVFWEGSQPYCVNLPHATLLQANEARGKILIGQAQRVYQNLVTPIPLFFLNGSLTLDDLFAPGVIGRVDPFGIFSGTTFADYFYVFAASPTTVVPSVNIVKTSVNMTTPNPSVYIRVDILFAIPGNPPYPVLNITESGTFTFAPNNTIITADLIAHNLGFDTDSSLVDRSAFVTQICTEYFSYCNITTDPLGYYNTPEECYNTLFDPTVVRQETWYGATNVTFDQAAGNTQVCRHIHVSIAKYSPVPHCTHAGRTGGGQCTDAAGAFGPNAGPYYTSYYTAAQNYF